MWERERELIPCADGRPCTDRQWTECYAQLVGTVLSLWDAAALDAAGGEEVPATFINLADASIKMVRVFTVWADRQFRADAMDVDRDTANSQRIRPALEERTELVLRR